MSRKLFSTLLLTFSLGGAVAAFAQDPNPPSPPRAGGWRRFDPSTATPPDSEVPPPGAAQQPPAQQRYSPPPPPPQASAPSRITLPAGTWITVRVSEPISSDHNQPGDAFMATLAQPIIADGLVVARRGQSVTGVVSESKKAGRVEGVSRLGLEITELGLADGRLMQVKTRMMERKGDTSYGRDAAGIGATVGTGAAIGAAVNGGVGAGVGAAAGVVASAIGVMLTRGRPTVVYPEQALSFRLEQPLTIDTTEAFRPVSQEDYDRTPARRPAPRPGPGPGYGYGAPPPPPPPYYYGYYYPPYGGFYGPNFYFSTGPGFFVFRGHGRRW